MEAPEPFEPIHASLTHDPSARQDLILCVEEKEFEVLTQTGTEKDGERRMHNDYGKGDFFTLLLVSINAIPLLLSAVE